MRPVLPCILSAFLLVSFTTGCGSGASPSSTTSPAKNPVPAIVSVSPMAILAGSPAQLLTVTGSNFIAASVVSFNGAALTTTFVSATSLTASVPAAALAAGASVNVTVSNPAPGGGMAAASSFSITSPTPVVASLSPAVVPQGRAATITIAGTGFEANSTVLWNGSPRPTTFVSGTSLTVALTAADTQAFGSGTISVNNPGPGGSVSAPVTLPVTSPPSITAVAPASIVAGSPTQTVTLTGTGFVSSSSVALDGVVLQTAFVSATTLKAVIPAADLGTGRTGSLTVANAPSEGGLSAVFGLPITSPAPSLTALAPAVIRLGSAATITLTGTGFQSNSTATWKGASRPTTFLSTTSLQVSLSAADLAAAGTGAITVTNAAPGGGTSAALTLTVFAPPVITAVSPNSLPVNTGTSVASAPLTITGTGFAATATATLRGVPLTITSQTATQIVATVPASALYTGGNDQVVVSNPATAVLPPADSAPFNLAIINPSAPLYVSPAYAVAGSPDTTITVNSQGVFPDSVVLWNGTPLVTTFSSNSLSAVIPATLLASPSANVISLNTPENLGQASATAPFSTFLALPVNDLVWSSRDSLIYATIGGSAGPGLGNSLVGIDPTTGVIQKTIFVGSEPNRLALSDDGTRAFVGLDGAGAVREVNLQTGVAGVQFSLGGGPGIYNLPYLAKGLAVLPGQPDAVSVYSSDGIVTIYDSGVARPNSSTGLATYFTSNFGSLAFGTSASTLYLSSQTIGNNVYRLTVDSTGITAAVSLPSSGGGTTLQYDSGRLYFPNGLVADAATGATLGQFSVPATFGSGATPANGPIVSDSALNRAFIVTGSYGSASTLDSFDETSFNPIASTGLSGVGATGNGFGSPADLIRWGQAGLAFHTSSQLYITQGQLVKDTSSTPADLSITAQLPATATTGSSLTYQLTVQNSGPNAAAAVSVVASLPAAITFAQQATTSQGSCTVGGALLCDLGALANGASATITLTGSPSSAGSFQTLATVASQTFDPAMANNQAAASTTVNGGLVSPVPAISSLSPKVAPTGSTSLTLTVNGSNFTTASTVQWSGTALPTTFVNASQLTATVDSSLLTSIGWAGVSVSSAAPGGGLSPALTFSVYGLLNIPANAILYDPFTRKLYAALPSTSTTLTGNSIVAIDPATGNTGTPVAVGSEPNLLAETSSGNLLYIGLSGAQSVGRFDLTSQTLTGTYPLQTSSYFGGNVPTAATGLSTLPGLDNSVSAAGVGILDISGATATVRPNSNVGYNNAIFPDASHVYTYDNQSTGADFYRSTVDASGVHQLDGTSLNGLGGFSGGFALDHGLVYGAAGGIIDPSTAVPSQIALLPLGAGPYQTGLVGGGVVPYATEQKSFNSAINDAGTALAFVERFDTVHFVLEDVIEIPTGAFYGINGTRWGQDGLAYILPPTIGSSGPSQLMILRGPFVLPAEASTNPVPTLSSTGLSLVAGSGNQYLTVTGTGFLPGAGVLWNGVVYSTNFVDAQHLSVAVAAADVSTAASITLTCQNPGSPVSGAVTLTVQ